MSQIDVEQGHWHEVFLSRGHAPVNEVPRPHVGFSHAATLTFE